MLNDFFNWLTLNTNLANSSKDHYKNGLKSISKEMLSRDIIDKPLEDMSVQELEIAYFCIFQDTVFLEKNNRGNNMYSNSLKHYMAFVKDVAKNDIEDNFVKSIKKDNTISETEKETIILARLGQGKFRKLILEKYNSRCVISGISDTRLLIAGHIKPWAVCDNNNRIDPENGLLFNNLYDKMFDLGIMTFSEKGKILISKTFKEKNIKLIGLDTERIYDLQLTDKMKQNLEYHRDIIFLK